jgi:hypothetical protein
MNGHGEDWRAAPTTLQPFAEDLLLITAIKIATNPSEDVVVIKATEALMMPATSDVVIGSVGIVDKRR